MRHLPGLICGGDPQAALPRNNKKAPTSCKSCSSCRATHKKGVSSPHLQGFVGGEDMQAHLPEQKQGASKLQSQNVMQSVAPHLQGLVGGEDAQAVLERGGGAPDAQPGEVAVLACQGKRRGGGAGLCQNAYMCVRVRG